MEIDFEARPKTFYIRVMPYKAGEKKVISNEIEKLLKKRVITLCDMENEDFTPTIFAKKQKHGKMRTILNLNKHVKYNHFKLALLSEAFKIIQSNCWMTSAGLKYVFYSIPVKQSRQNYFRYFRQPYHKWVCRTDI